LVETITAHNTTTYVQCIH